MRRAFVLGAVLGILSGFALLELGVPGLALVLVGLVLSMRYPWALSSVSGLLVGVGATVLLLIGASNLRCAAANQVGPGFQTGCTPPDSSLLLTLAALAVAAGLATGVVAMRRPIAAGARKRAASSPD